MATAGLLQTRQPRVMSVIHRQTKLLANAIGVKSICHVPRTGSMIMMSSSPSASSALGGAFRLAAARECPRNSAGVAPATVGMAVTSRVTVVSACTPCQKRGRQGPAEQKKRAFRMAWCRGTCPGARHAYLGEHLAQVHVHARARALYTLGEAGKVRVAAVAIPPPALELPVRQVVQRPPHLDPRIHRLRAGRGSGSGDPDDIIDMASQ
jgi:hypothetical protein